MPLPPDFPPEPWTLDPLTSKVNAENLLRQAEQLGVVIMENPDLVRQVLWHLKGDDAVRLAMAAEMIWPSRIMDALMLETTLVNTDILAEHGGPADAYKKHVERVVYAISEDTRLKMFSRKYVTQLVHILGRARMNSRDKDMDKGD